ncbi:MAG: sigma 54-interacting transcriptional regulator [Planctomycetes bacterium]|nr:sigma 54-interacting transcriptional regulator [Planctomycetota bacterium]
MLAIAGADSTDDVLRRVVDGIAACETVALCRIWLVRTADDAHGETRWLQLAASAGNLRDPQANPRRLDGRFSRFEIGDRKVGRVAAQGTGVLLANVADDPRWIADPEWIAAEGIVSFAAQPLVARGATLGVLALFDRTRLPDADFRWLRTFADHAAVSIASARAYEEIERLHRQLELENEYLRTEVTEPFSDIHGSSPALQKVLRQVEMVAPTDATVLILGESGVGKELVARAIHERSARRDRPLIKVNCGSIPGELFESEFFGHVKGSFTGAVRDRVGRFELANGGSLFLDEIGEIPLVHQSKLLRVLQEGTFERVGEEKTRRADVHVIAATNRDLAVESNAGRFRSDLYYRLSVFPIEVPPLRERREDVAQLAAHFIERSARSLNLRKPKLTRAQAEQLEAYAWPGNVRELGHVIERAMILARGGPLQFPELGPSDGVLRRGSVVRDPPMPAAELPTLADLRAREREVIEAALARAGGKVAGKSGAAALLGVPATTLESKLRALGLKPARRTVPR